jgi:hypothetical protein
MPLSLSPHQFSEAMDIVKTSRGLIKGDDARTVFRAANIRSWPMEDSPVGSGRAYGIESEGGVTSDEVLHTSQGHLHGPTIRKYMQDGGVPEEDPHNEGRKYLPEVLTSARGHKWIDEGHHRLVASRLRGDFGTETYEGYLK